MVGVRKRAPVNYAEPKGEEEFEGAEPAEEIPSGDEVEKDEDVAKPKKRAPTRQRKRRAPDALPEMAGDTTLLDAIRSESTAITVAARDWVDRFRGHRSEATAEALTFLMQACGLTDQAVTSQDVEHIGADELKAEADAAAQAHGLSEAVAMGGRSAAARHLRASYREMWDKLIREAAVAGQLQGGFFLDKAVNLSIALNTSLVRELRRVGTITAIQMATSMLHVVATLGESRDTAAGQAEAERAKGGKAAGQRAAAFERQVQQATSAMQEMLAYVDAIFQSVFMIRFRDIDADIRGTVVTGIGAWMRLLPATFLTTSYLKYVAWALSDKDAGVRLEAANTLCTLYADPENAGQLREFSDRFADRFKELMEDKDDAVAVAGVRLATLLVRAGHLPAELGLKVVRLTSDASPALRAAAADLAAGMLKDLGREALGSGAAGPSAAAGRGRGKKNVAPGQRSDEEVELAGVLRVLRMLAAEEADMEGDETGVDVDPAEAPPLAEGLTALVVSSLAPRTAALRNWRLMVEWLKADTAVEALGDAAGLDLARCLVAALRCAAGPGAAGHHSAGRGRDRQAAARDTARQDATLALQKELQALLRKFQSQPALAEAVVSLIPELKLEVYSLRRQEAALASLLTTVKEVYFMHDDRGLARACTDALVCCVKEGPDTTKDAARAVLSECVTSTALELDKAASGLELAGTAALAAAAATFRSSGGQEESPELFAARAAACRAVALVEVHPSGFAASATGREGLGRILELAAAGVDLPAPLITATAKAALILLVSDLADLDHESPDLSALGRLSAAQSTLASQLEAIARGADSRGAMDLVQAVATAQADLMTVFSAHNLPEALREAAYRPSDAAVSLLWKGMEAALVAPPTPEPGVEVAPSSSTAMLRLPAATSAQIVARLCAGGAVPQYRQLAAQLLSHWHSPDAPSVGEIAKDLVRRLKAVDSEHLPGIYLGAMQVAYQRCKAAAEAERESGADVEEDDMLAPFIALSEGIANSLASFNSPAATLAFVTTEGAKWALEGGLDREDFLQGTSYFMVRVKGAAAEKVLAEIVEAAAQVPGVPAFPRTEDEEEAEDEESDWGLYLQYCEALQTQSERPTGGARRRGGGARGRAKAAAGRRISFAPGAGEESSDEEEGVLVRKPKQAPVRTQPTRGRGANPAPVLEASSDEEEEEEELVEVLEEPAMDFPVVGHEDVQQEAESEEEGGESEEEEEEEEEEGPGTDVLPTEEQLPGMRGRSSGAAADTDPAAASDSESEEEEEELHARRRRPRR